MVAVPTAIGAEESARIVKVAPFPGTSEVAVVAEGDLEPRSIGSYSLRIYAGAKPEFPYDDLIAGTVRPRDGTVEDIRFFDLDRDGSSDIIVIIRSAGTGGYLSADAFRFRARSLALLASVSGLDKKADPIRALAAKINDSAEHGTALDAGKPRR